MLNESAQWTEEEDSLFYIYTDINTEENHSSETDSRMTMGVAETQAKQE